ncbi:MAG: hypothetical protein ACRD0L_12170 [Acidimicrobiales bacterium]
MREKRLSFKGAVNDAIRAGLGGKSRSRFRQRTFALGFRPDISYDKALQIASRLDDEELARKLAIGK